MCTVSWIRHDEGYQLLCNRDEKLTRKPALAPRLAVRNGTQFVAPEDGDFGGTWIGTNEFGVSACLLNGTTLTGSENPAAVLGRSRGLMLLELIPLPSIAAMRNQLEVTNLSAFAPFTFAALEPGHPAAVVEWDGSTKSLVFIEADRYMLTSSSFDSEAVRRSREEQYRDADDSDALFAFHRSHMPERSAYSTCMHRADAKTVSFSWIQVSREETSFFYTPGAPCEELPAVRVILPGYAGVPGSSLVHNR